LAIFLFPMIALLAAPKSGFIFETAPFASCHASTIVETKPGVFLAAWFGGDDEGKPNVAIWSSQFENGKWSAPVELAREPQIATYNPVLFHTKDRTLWLYYKFGPHPSDWSAGRDRARTMGRRGPKSSTCRRESTALLKTSLSFCPMERLLAALQSKATMRGRRGWSVASITGRHGPSTGPSFIPARRTRLYSRPLFRLAVIASGCLSARRSELVRSPLRIQATAAKRGRLCAQRNCPIQTAESMRSA
jgi:hypothetical protein